MSNRILEKTDLGKSPKAHPEAKKTTLSRSRRMDISAYEAAYPDKKIALINDLNGDVQRWIDAGAVPIESRLPNRKVYKGLTDAEDGNWVRFVGGEVGGKPYYVYALMMDPVLYHEFKNVPDLERQRQINEALHSGRSLEDSSSQPQHLKSYAPTLPDGMGVGYNEIRPNLG